MPVNRIEHCLVLTDEIGSSRILVEDPNGVTMELGLVDGLETSANAGGPLLLSVPGEIA